MKYKLTKSWCGGIELIYGDTTVILTDDSMSIILTEEEFSSIPEHKQYLIKNGMIIVEMLEDEVVEVIPEKKHNKNK